MQTPQGAPVKEVKIRKRKPKHMLNVVLLFCATVFVVFTVVILYIFIKDQIIPDTLVTCVYSALGVESGATAFIKWGKLKNIKYELVVEQEKLEMARLNAVLGIITQHKDDIPPDIMNTIISCTLQALPYQSID